MLMSDAKMDKRRKVLLLKQEEKIVIEKERGTMKKWKEDFTIFTVNTKGMDPHVMAVQMFYIDMILKEIVD
jgi:hypothetical protein